MRLLKRLHSVRGYMLVLVLSATAIAVTPSRAEAACAPCGYFACMFPDGICRSVNSLWCNGGRPGQSFYCHEPDCIGCCSYLIVWGSC